MRSMVTANGPATSGGWESSFGSGEWKTTSEFGGLLPLGAVERVRTLREQYVNTSTWRPDPLSSHGGTGANLLLRWNDMPAAPSAIDVVVHLHGYIAMQANEKMLRVVAGRSGLDVWGRMRPTLAILPRGRLITLDELQERQKYLDEVARKAGTKPETARSDAYTFPALWRNDGAGLEALITGALQWYAQQLGGGALPIARLIFTAHSGGGAALDRLVKLHQRRRLCNPDEVHVFDALSSEATGLKSWAATHLLADRDRRGDMETLGGGLRVFYGPGGKPKKWSEDLGRSLPSGGDVLSRLYRVECTLVDHNQMPNLFGPTLLRNRAADWPSLKPCPVTATRATGAIRARSSQAEWVGPSPTNARQSFGGLEFEGPRPVPRPAPNAVDADAAEPIFSGRARSPEAPLLHAATLKLSSGFNQATHPKVSGITLAELHARLERYLDRAALDDLVRRVNAGAASPYGSDEATVVTLLAHQFQRKTCRAPTVGEITKPCTMNGRVAEDTLDALGFVYHAGSTLNEADQGNSVAATILGRLPAIAFAAVEPGLTAKSWWSYMVSPSWLGMPIKHGIHLVLLKRLRSAQRALMSLPAYAGLSPAELGRALGLEEEHKGARPYNTNLSMHLFGLAIDIGHTRNPWVSNPERNTTKLAAITLRAARLLGPSAVGGEGITARFLHGLATAHRDTAKIHKILADRSRWLAEYFALGGNAKQLEGLLPIANVIYPDGGWFKPGESLAQAAGRWTGVVRADFEAFATAVSRGGNKNDVRHGFMDLARDLVIALRDEACLGWGAVDFGPTVSGDIMHFDCRIEGIGRTIAKSSAKPFVPEAGHLCLPVPASEIGQPELEWEVPRKPSRAASATKASPPPKPGRWLAPFTSKAIPTYSSSQSTGCSIYMSDAALQQSTIDLLVFFHGDPSPCSATFSPDPKKTALKFGLDEQIHSSGRQIALAVPALFWTGNDADIRGIWTADNFNKFVEEVSSEIGKQSGVKPSLGRLIIAGHSHAYAILTSLACEFDQDAPATKTGALAQLAEVWALDSTYGPWHAYALEVWARKLPKVWFSAVFNKNGPPLAHWNSLYKPADYCRSGFKTPLNLTVCVVSDGPGTHCKIPAKYVRSLLSLSSIWCSL